MAFAHERGVVHGPHRRTSPRGRRALRRLRRRGVTSRRRAQRSGQILGTLVHGTRAGAGRLGTNDAAPTYGPSGQWPGSWPVGTFIRRAVRALGCCSRQPAGPPVLTSHVPKELADVIDRALSFEPEARWSDAGICIELAQHPGLTRRVPVVGSIRNGGSHRVAIDCAEEALEFGAGPVAPRAMC